MTTQKKMVLDYIREFGSITPLDGFRDLGVTRLADVVFRLRKDGHDIDKVIETGENRFGQLTMYARYSFGKDKSNENQAR